MRSALSSELKRWRCINTLPTTICTFETEISGPSHAVHEVTKHECKCDNVVHFLYCYINLMMRHHEASGPRLVESPAPSH